MATYQLSAADRAQDSGSSPADVRFYHCVTQPTIMPSLTLVKLSENVFNLKLYWLPLPVVCDSELGFGGSGKSRLCNHRLSEKAYGKRSK